MIVIDINRETLQNLNNQLTGNMILYLEKPEIFELYSMINNILFRAKLNIPQEESERLLFYENNLKGFIRINDISQINEPEWKTYFNNLFQLIQNLEDKLNELTEK